jgi:serine/threonine-protein kinase
MLPLPPRHDTLVDAPGQHAETWHSNRAASEPATTALPVIPGYQVLSLLGRGAMGRVYKALHLGLQRHDAIKMVTLGADARVLQRFALEAQALARVRHPNVAQIYDVGEADGQPFLAMELVEGGNLADYLAARPQDPAFAARLLETLARAVHHCHHEGVLHRDLKPANILLDQQLTPKITDFGLAKLVLDESQRHTRTGDVLGTPCYMAPEQASGMVKELGPAVDVYALGSILYECLTGRPPFQTPEVYQTLLLVITQDPVPPSVLLPKLPRDLNTICMKCLQKSPKRRYESAEALADDLRRYLDGQPIQARPVSRVEKAWKWLRRHPAWAAALGLGGILLLSVVVSYFQIQSALHQTREAKQESDIHLDVARDAIKSLARRYVEELPPSPQTEKLQREGLEDARRFYEKLARARPQDAAGRVQHIRDLLELARLQQELGQLKESAETLDRAGPEAEKLDAKSGPDRDVYRSVILTQRAQLALHQGQMDSAKKLLDKAAPLQETLRDHASNRWALEEQIKYHATMARVASGTKNLPHAEAEYRLTLQLLQQLIKQLGYHDDAKLRDLAIAHNNLGSVLLHQRKREEAVREFEQALRLLPADDTRRGRELSGQLETNLGVVAEELNRPADAEKAYVSAAYRFERLAADFPTLPDYRFNTVKVKLNHAVLAGMQGRSSVTRKILDEVRPVVDQLVKDYPSRAAYQEELKRVRQIDAILQAEAKPPGAKP